MRNNNLKKRWGFRIFSLSNAHDKTKNVFHQEEFVWQSSASLVADHFLYSHDCNEWFRGNMIGRNYMLVTLRCHRATNGLSNSWLCCRISNVITHSLRRQLLLYAELISNGWTDDNIGCDILNRQWKKTKQNKTKTGEQLHRSTRRPTWMCRFQGQETWAEAQESLLLSSSFCSCHLKDLSLLPICTEWFCRHPNSLHKLKKRS